MKLVMLEDDTNGEPVPEAIKLKWQAKTAEGLLAKVLTAIHGKLTLVVKAEGGAVAMITDIPVGVPPCVRRTAQLAWKTLDEA